MNIVASKLRIFYQTVGKNDQVDTKEWDVTEIQGKMVKVLGEDGHLLSQIEDEVRYRLDLNTTFSQLEYAVEKDGYWGFLGPQTLILCKEWISILGDCKKVLQVISKRDAKTGDLILENCRMILKKELYEWFNRVDSLFKSCYPKIQGNELVFVEEIQQSHKVDKETKID